MKKTALAGILTLALAVPLSRAAVITFEDLAFASGNYENGTNLGGSESTLNDPYGPSSGSLVTRTNLVTSGGGPGVTVVNQYSRKFSGPDGTGSLEFDFWSDWAYSKDTDTTTSGFGNQYSAISGSGAGGSANYLIGYQSGPSLSLTFAADENFAGRGLELTNTTYAHNDMRDGSGFSKKFGGVFGNDADWFLLTIEGFNDSLSQGTVEFYLADFRYVDNGFDYILDEWTFVDLSSLGTIDELRFTLSSSDMGMFGINTPTYFALDNVGVIPEPSGTALLLAGMAILLGARRQNRKGRRPAE
jgi:hypothetical protein